MTFDENGKVQRYINDAASKEPTYFDAEKVVIIKDRGNAVIGIDELARVLREKLLKTKAKDAQGLMFEDKTPVNSLRKLAKYMDYENGYSYISKFAKNNAMPCITTLNKIANAYSVAYVIGNYPDPKPEITEEAFALPERAVT